MLRKFRPEIQLLRAIAVLAVLVYHVVPTALPGGFIGVDVFFVISGFLITSHMLGEVERTGKLSLSQFWANRVRRILPAATVAIVVTVIGALVFLPTTQLGTVAKQAVASALYVQNFVLAAQSVDYLGQNAAPSPFQHFWSLSVEEQFYLVWPFVVVVAIWLAKLGARSHNKEGVIFHRRFRLVVFFIFSVVCIVSFVWSVSLVDASNPAAYFVTPTRMWELGIGGLLACYLGDPQEFPMVRKVLAIVGVATIVFTSVVYTGEAPKFPGASALLPTFGAVAVIIAGETRGLISLSPIVNWKPVQLTGLWSYSLYLWHFPLVVFFRERNGRDAQGISEIVALVAISFVLAMLSYYYLEQPIRVAPFLKKSNRRTLVVAGVAVALTATVALTPLWKQAATIVAEQKAIQRLSEDQSLQVGRASLNSSAFTAFIEGYEGIVSPSLSNVGKDQPQYPCAQVPTVATGSETTPCVVANENGAKTLAVVGDSHASQWVPALEKVVEGTDWKLVVYLHNSCPFSLAARNYETHGELKCTEPNKEVINKLLQLKPNRILITNLAVTDIPRQPDEEYAGTKGFVEAWKPLARAGIPITVLHDTPYTGNKKVIPDCVATQLRKGSVDKCGIPRSKIMHMAGTNGALYAAVQSTKGANFIDLTDAFCTDTECPAVIGNELVYRDTNHVTKTYMLTVADELKKKLNLDG